MVSSCPSSWTTAAVIVVVPPSTLGRFSSATDMAPPVFRGLLLSFRDRSATASALNPDRVAGFPQWIDPYANAALAVQASRDGLVARFPQWIDPYANAALAVQASRD